MKSVFKVQSQSEVILVQKQDGTSIQKSTIVLQEFGGPYEDTFAATMLGNQVKLFPGDLVLCSLRFTSREYTSGQSSQPHIYQDVTIQAISKLM